MSTNIAFDFMDAGHRIFGLYGGASDGSCKCGNPECKAAFKHPIASNWQHTPEWSEEQVETYSELGHYKTGYGVLVKGLLVVDVDARNGGVASLVRLIEALGGLDLARNAGLTVATGSGQGSMHIYYRAPEGVSLVQSHPEFKGIDFKSSGFVVGPGSMHASGNTYEIVNGSAHDIGDAPAELLEILKRPDAFRAEYNGSSMDVTEQDLVDMIRHVDCDSERETWLKCGMALHHATSGTGFHIWNSWSSQGGKYPGTENLRNQWDRFGKSANPVTLGTLIHHAEAGGWVESVTFTPSGDFVDVFEAPEVSPIAPVVNSVDTPATADKPKAQGAPFHTNGVDLLRPPGFVGEVCKWINDQSRFPRENLAVAAALTTIGNIGMRYKDDVDGVTSNLFSVCVAASATGKEAILQATSDLMRAASVSGAAHGSIKSEQEIIRNLTEHQAAFYSIDEFGLTLRKITNSKEAYHEGVVGTLMSIYSKADSFYQLTGDDKRQARREMVVMLKNARKAVAENEDDSGAIMRSIPRLEQALDMIDQGLEKPFLSLLGFTTPVTFDDLVTPDQARNGFIGRAIIVTEKETNPRAKPGFKKRPLGDRIKMTLSGMYDGGYYDGDVRRVEHSGEKTPIRTDREAVDMLDAVYGWAHNLAEMHKAATGFESIVRRAREMVSKLSLILAIPEGIRTAEHVRWAYAFIERDIREKVRLAYSNEIQGDDPKEAIRSRIFQLIDKDHSETAGVITNRCRKWDKTIVAAVLKGLVDSGQVKEIEDKNPTNNKTVNRYIQA